MKYGGLSGTKSRTKRPAKPSDKSSAQSTLSICPAHNLLYSHYCRRADCQQLLCLKCAELHKKLHSSSTISCLEASPMISQEMQGVHHRMNRLVYILALAQKSSRGRKVVAADRLLAGIRPLLAGRQKEAKEVTDKLGDLIAELEVSTMYAQNTRVGEIAGQFRTLKFRAMKSLGPAVDMLVAAHFLDSPQTAFDSDPAAPMPDLSHGSHTIYFADPVVGQKRRTLIQEDIAIAQNAQVLLLSDSILLINGGRQELFESVLANIADPTSATRFVPRQRLLSAMKGDFSLANVCNSYLYLVGSTCQRYAYYTDTWNTLPQLRMKQGAGTSLVLISCRYLYAFRGTHTMIAAEVLDILAEDSGWSLQFVKLLRPAMPLPDIERTFVFQQDNEGMCMVGNLSGGETKRPAETFYYDRLSSRMSSMGTGSEGMVCRAWYQTKGLGQAVAFVEENFDIRKVWLFHRHQKRFSLKYEYMQF